MATDDVDAEHVQPDDFLAALAAGVGGDRLAQLAAAQLAVRRVLASGSADDINEMRLLWPAEEALQATLQAVLDRLGPAAVIGLGLEVGDWLAEHERLRSLLSDLGKEWT